MFGFFPADEGSPQRPRGNQNAPPSPVYTRAGVSNRRGAEPACCCGPSGRGGTETRAEPSGLGRPRRGKRLSSHGGGRLGGGAWCVCVGGCLWSGVVGEHTRGEAQRQDGSCGSFA